MTLRRALIAVVIVAPVLAVATLASAGGRPDLEGAVPATAAFHDIDSAIAAGYTFRLPDVAGKTCIDQPGVGGMGVHMVDTSLLDGTLDPKHPEALVYEPEANGKLKLVALEYVIFASAWPSTSPPSLFGHDFDFISSPNRFGLPAFWALHAWLFKPNSSGLFFAWNPRVVCPA
jgi:hypothetical protein